MLGPGVRGDAGPTWQEERRIGPMPESVFIDPAIRRTSRH